MALAELGYPDVLVDEALAASLTLEGSINARAHIGGTSPSQVLQAIAFARQRLNT